MLDPPAFTLQPAPRSAPPGGNATFTAQVAGSAPFGFHWRTNGILATRIVSADGNSAFSLTNIPAAWDGLLVDVLVTNWVSPAGVLSSAARLTVGIAPVITGQPLSTNVWAGETALLCITATGTNLSFQWSQNGATRMEATNSCLLITNVQAADAGGYWALVSNPVGSVASSVAVLSLNGATPQIGFQEGALSLAISYDATNAANPILLTWEAIPTKLYRILTTTDLRQPWQTLTNTPLVASNNLVRFPTRADAALRFYRLAKLDTEPPAIRQMLPASNAIAVPLQSQLQILLTEETGIDTNSVVLKVGTNPPVTLADPRLTLAANVLTYTPLTNQFLGTNGQTLTNQLIIADTLGFRATNTWPFKLELAPVLAPNAIIISPGSALTLVSTNGDTFVFSYTNAASGLTNGAILLGSDPNFPYQRRVLSATDNPAAHTVSLVTTQASLSEFLRQGSVRFYTSDFTPDAPAGRQPKDGEGITIGLGGQKLLDLAHVKVETTSGRLYFKPYVHACNADFEWDWERLVVRMTAFDLDVSADMGFDLTMRASWEGEWSFAPDPLRIGPALRSRHLLGAIPTPIPIPIWAEAVWEFSVGTDGAVTGTASATAGMESSQTARFWARFRNYTWTHGSEHHATPPMPYPPTWQGGGSGRIKAFVEPRLTIYIQSLVGPTDFMRPYLELVGNACVQPGQQGVDVSLYPGMTGTLAMALRFWDKDWAALPAWEVFNIRPLEPIWHDLLAGAGGPPPNLTGNLVWIPCGTFTMGSPASEPARYAYEGPQTRVTISQGFWMGKHEVTQAEYQSVMGDNPSHFQGANLPVENVSWHDAVAYCAALTARERSAGRLPAGYSYRLPTEAEWEYACRAGTTTAFHYGNELRSGMANFYGYYEYPPCGSSTWYCPNPGGTYLGRTTSVGSYAPNVWGLYDKHGNA